MPLHIAVARSDIPVDKLLIERGTQVSVLEVIHQLRGDDKIHQDTRSPLTHSYANAQRRKRETPRDTRR